MFPCRFLLPLILALPSATSAGAADALIIAHRGASGYLPEHTLAAFELAHAQGADYLEADLRMTRDGVLVIRHDPTLEATTNVEIVFPDRRRSDGRWHLADFTLAEVRQLRAEPRRERRSVTPPATEHPLRVPTLDELIRLTQRLNTASGRDTGLYLETKDPERHRARGRPLEAPLLATLAHYGYRARTDPVFLQSFSADSLKRLRDLGTRLRLVQLIGNTRDNDARVTVEGLEAIAAYADGIGPHKRRIENAFGGRVDDNALVARAHARGLVVHPYTFRADDAYPTRGGYAAEVRRFVQNYGVDGLFTDHPDRAVAALRGE